MDKTRVFTAWQEEILERNRGHKEPHLINLFGIDYWMFEDCFSPCYAPASLLLMHNQGVKKGEHVLIPFSGPGFDARLAYQNGASRVVTTELCEMPYLCSRYNTLREGLQDIIDNRRCNGLSLVKKEEKFDLVLANPPFQDAHPQSNLERSIKDFGHRALKSFFCGVGHHLKSGGRIRVVFSNPDEPELILGFAKNQRLNYKVVAQEEIRSDVYIRVYEFRVQT